MVSLVAISWLEAWSLKSRPNLGIWETRSVATENIEGSNGLSSHLMAHADATGFAPTSSNCEIHILIKLDFDHASKLRFPYETPYRQWFSVILH